MLLFCSRKLHACVDWNLKWINAKVAVLGRKLHACVDWNEELRELKGDLKVASYTLAWIEIRWMKKTALWRSRRKLHACVDWNRISSLDHFWGSCRKLHACVDWNFIKSSSDKNNAIVASYMLAWIEITRTLTCVCLAAVASYMLAWVEIDFIVQISLEV